jgi:hypothetical protein
MRTAAPPDVPGLISGGRTRRRRRNAAWTAGGILAAVIAAGGVYGVAQLGGDDDAATLITKQPTPQPVPDASEPVAIEPGTYLVPEGDHVVAPYTITVPAGWTAQHGIDIGKHQDRQRAIAIQPFVLDQIRLTDDTCHGEETLGASQTSAASLVAGLRAQDSGLRVSDPVPDTVGGREATRVDLDYPGTTPLPDCRLSNTSGSGPGWLQIWSGYFVMQPAATASVYVVDVGDRAQVFVTPTRDGASDADRAELQSILGSISFQTGAK